MDPKLVKRLGWALGPNPSILKHWRNCRQLYNSPAPAFQQVPPGLPIVASHDGDDIEASLGYFPTVNC